MGLSDKEGRILGELEEQFTKPSRVRKRAQRLKPGPTWLHRIGWLAAVLGLVLMIALLMVSFLAAFVGVVLMLAGIFLIISHWREKVNRARSSG